MCGVNGDEVMVKGDIGKGGVRRVKVGCRIKLEWMG